MKIGEKNIVSVSDIAIGLVGKLATVKFEDDPEYVKVRVTSVGQYVAEVVVVDPSTKE